MSGYERCACCGRLVEVRRSACLSGWLVQYRKGPEHNPRCLYYVETFPDDNTTPAAGADEGRE